MIRYNLGILAEYCVLIYYLIRLYQPLHHRYKSYGGEIDLIMKRGNQLVFIEVKARKLGLHDGIVSANQQQRITRTAELFITKHPQYNRYNMRFDLVVVKPYRLPRIIKNAW
ncbi:MAG: YraN family protein [Rickettsiaceae bacterium]|jgi:putative endonuclease|nr:YraN family protein [Rickettsiaceae bacterium]